MGIRKPAGAATVIKGLQALLVGGPGRLAVWRERPDRRADAAAKLSESCGAIEMTRSVTARRPESGSGEKCDRASVNWPPMPTVTTFQVSR